MRVLPDVVGIDREFDYLVPSAWTDDGRAERISVGSMVRVPLAGRRVDGWVTAVDVDPEPGVRLVELTKLRGMGPAADLIELSTWAAWRWAGRRVPFLRSASPDRLVAGAVRRRRRADPLPAGPVDVFADAFEQVIATVRVAPDDDGYAVALEACRRGDALVVCADARRARHLAVTLRRAGVTVALAPDDWAVAAGGATVVGTRGAAWMPMPELAAAVVIDEHDERLKEERTPAWHARDVVIERARRAGVPVVLTSPVPSLEALRAGPLLRRERSLERTGWPVLEVLDRRADDPTKAGVFAERLRDHLVGERVICVLNRTGRARLLACSVCGELVRSADGRGVMRLEGDELVSADGGERRPVVCEHCGSTRLKNLRMGVDRAREELAAFVGESVDEVTATTEGEPSSRVVIGTEAVLHRVTSASTVVFLDFDQELMAVRVRASEQALGLLALAARLTGGRERGGRIVVQTRQPDHEVIDAARRGDPAIVAVAERDRRRPLRLAPYGAQAVVSGSGAAAFIDALGDPDGVLVRGPLDGRWSLRADRHEPLLDALAATPRPAARVRIEVDPLRS